MKKRWMVIGPAFCGKTSLIDSLTGNRPLKPSRQDVIYTDQAIDVPGMYIENSMLHQRLISLSQGASHVLFLIEKTGSLDVYPPGFAGVFTCPVIGVVTKADTIAKDNHIGQSQWKYIGVKQPVYNVDTKTNLGIEELRRRLISS